MSGTPGVRSRPCGDPLHLTLGESYTIERELGGGGMSRVFVDRELALGREVVKWLARGVAEYDSMLRTHGRGPLFDHLRADPQGAALFAKMESFKA